MPLLDVKNLTTKFHTRHGEITAVDNVSFQLEKGQTLGIVGESGSGKSVCCYSLLGLLPCPPAKIESGSALFEGIDLIKANEKKLRSIRGNDIAFIFQDPMTSLNPYLTIGEQLIEPLIYHQFLSRKTAKYHAIEMLDKVGIPKPHERFHQYPHEFSGGMRQRVMIAMALITEPKLLIADEPTTALDVTIQQQILELISSIQKEKNLAMIFISHDLAVVKNLVDQVVVMKKGNIVEHSEPDELFLNPKHPYTQKLLSAIPSGMKHTDHNSEVHNLLKIKDLEVTYYNNKNPFKAVNGVTFDIKQGEILGLVGESGSGKSTVGKSLIRLIEPTKGEIIFDDEDLTYKSPRQMRPLRRRIQMIFQDPYASLNPRMTVFDTLAEPFLFHGLATRKTVEKQVLQLMDEVGLARHFLRKYPHEFSGGQRQRIAIGRAIATHPEFIIADEPVSALDVTIQKQILELILYLVDKHQLTMLFISHDLSVVRYLCDRIMVMKHGNLIEIDNTENIWQSPKKDYTKNLLSASCI